MKLKTLTEQTISLKEKKIHILSGIAFLIAVFFSQGYHHFDEHFQILEFAGSKLGTVSSEHLPWEYHSKMRPTLQPIMVVIVHNIFALTGQGDPFTIAFFFRLLSAIFTWATIWILYRVHRPRFKEGQLQQWFLVFSFLLWFLVYTGVRFSSENWSGISFALAYALYFSIRKDRLIYFFGIGCLLGFSFLFRFQSGFLVLGFSMWLFIIDHRKFSELTALLSGIVLVVIAGVLMDSWFYGEWVITSWNYLDQNLIQGKVSSFGEAPWYWYFGKVLEKGAPLSLLFIPATFVFCLYRSRHAITWSIVPFLFVHFAIGHKESRFLFPIIVFMPFIMMEGIAVLKERYFEQRFFERFVIPTINVLLFSNYILLVVIAFRPADNQIGLYHSIYRQYDSPTTLYYIQQNPYLRVYDIEWYKKRNLDTQKITALKDIQEDMHHHQLIVFNHKHRPKGFEKKHRLVYASFPEWVLLFNFNHWIERTNAWYVYELSGKP